MSRSFRIEDNINQRVDTFRQTSYYRHHRLCLYQYVSDRRESLIRIFSV
jgi:hypothetical protein